jgi:hypothetical protein
MVTTPASSRGAHPGWRPASCEEPGWLHRQRRALAGRHAPSRPPWPRPRTVPHPGPWYEGPIPRRAGGLEDRGWKGTVPSWPTLIPTALIPPRRAKQARAHSEALWNQLAEAAEAVAEVEQEAARVHHSLAEQGGPLAEQAREHAERAEDLAAKERAEAQRLARPTATEPALRLLDIERLGWVAQRARDGTARCPVGRLDLDRGPARVVLRFDTAPAMFGGSTVELVPLPLAPPDAGVVDTSELTEGGQAA